MVTYASESKKMGMGAVGVGDGTFAVIDRGDDIAFEVGAWRLALGNPCHCQRIPPPIPFAVQTLASLLLVGSGRTRR